MLTIVLIRKLLGHLHEFHAGNLKTGLLKSVYDLANEPSLDCVWL